MNRNGKPGARALAFVTLLLAAMLSAAARPDPAAGMPPLPPLSNPPSGERLYGKLVFADYFTSDLTQARRFYGALFGWQWRWASPTQRYGIFYQNDVAVAGLVQYPQPDESRPYGRWIYYLSTPDVQAATATIRARGGRVLLEPRTLPDRGELAVVADAQNAPFGLLRSSSGDPPDYRASPGEWLWINLYTRNAKGSAALYQELFGYEAVATDAAPGVVNLILERDGYARAGVSPLPERAQAKPTWLGYVRVTDVADVVARAERLGGVKLWGADAPGGNADLAVVADPIGATFALIRMDFEAFADEEVLP